MNRTVEESEQTASWIDQELAGCEFGDVRLGRRFRTLVERLSEGIGEGIPMACQDWADTKAAHRFFSSDQVSEAEILSGRFQATRDRFQVTVGPVLVLHDTTEFSFQREKKQAIGATTMSYGGKDADGKLVWRKPTLLVTYGHNKDHRPDRKQLLFVLTESADGAVPIHYSAMDGKTSDSTTHIDTWETLRKLAGWADFPYVADCKLCSKASLEHIAKQGGRFITVLPRNRCEDRWFREFIQVNEPPWKKAVRRPHLRRRSGPEDVVKVVEAQLLSKEGYRIVWVWNSLMALEDDEGRQARIEKARLGIERLQTKLQGKRCRLRLREEVEETAAKILKEAGAERWVRVEITERKEPVFRQEKRGHPGPKTPVPAQEAHPLLHRGARE